MMITAGDIMTRQVVTLRPEESAEAAAQKLIDHGVSAAPVVDDAGCLVGILSEGDFVAYPSKTGVKGRWLRFLYDQPEPRLEDLASSRRMRVGHLMTRDVVAVADNTPIDVVARLMTRRRVKRLPVIRDGKLAGIVSRVDLLAALIAVTHPD